MIGYLEGTVKHFQAGKIILYCNGVGYTVLIPSTYQFKPAESASLYIHTHFREDDLKLYGFKTAEDLDLFELLISVSGVGPKIGQGIFSQSTSQNIISAISQSNLNFFTAISGVGKKTAQRIILDLKNKIDKGDVNFKNLQGNSELLDSLTSLGFTKSEVSKIVTEIDSTLDLPSQVKQALRLLQK